MKTVMADFGRLPRGFLDTTIGMLSASSIESSERVRLTFFFLGSDIDAVDREEGAIDDRSEDSEELSSIGLFVVQSELCC